MDIQVAPPAPSFVLEAPAHKMVQAGRTVYYLALRMAQFDDALPEEVDSKIITHNRRFKPNHAKAIEDYLTAADRWVLGPITLSVDPAHIEFTQYPGQEGVSVPLVGVLRVKEGARTSLKIIDGQHRRRAIRDYRKADSADEDQERRRLFDESQMPVAIYEEGEEVAIRQMFADMAQQRTPDAITKARFDMRDPFNRAAEDVMDQSSWLKRYVEMNSSSVARTSDKLISFNQLSTNLKTLEYGYYGRASRVRLQEAANDLPRIVDQGLAWTDEFLPSARHEYLALLSEDIEPGFLPQERPSTLAYNGTLLRILAGARFAWEQLDPPCPVSQLEEFTQTVDFRPRVNRGVLAETGVVQTATVIGRRQEVQAAIDLIVEKAAATR